MFKPHVNQRKIPFKGHNEKGRWLGDVFLEQGFIATARSINFKVKRLQHVALTDGAVVFGYGMVESIEHFLWDDFVKIAESEHKRAGFLTASGWVKAFIRLHRNRKPERVHLIVIGKVNV